MTAGLAEALYKAAALSTVLPPEKVLRELAGTEAGFSLEFKRAYNEVCTGADVESALRGIADRSRDTGLRRAANILALGCSTGGSIAELLKEAADDALKTEEIIRERSAGLAVERWTLLLAGGLIVPLLLGTTVRLVSGLDLEPLAEFGLSQAAGGGAALLASAIIGDQVYVVFYAAIASVFVAYAEGEPRRAACYAALLAPLSLLLFNAAMRLGLPGF